MDPDREKTAAVGAHLLEIGQKLIGRELADVMPINELLDLVESWVRPWLGELDTPMAVPVPLTWDWADGKLNISIGDEQYRR